MIFVTGIFVLIENSLRRLRPGRLEEQAEEGNAVAEKLLNEQEYWERYIQTAQFIRAICVLFLGFWGVLPLEEYLSSIFENNTFSYGISLISILFFLLNITYFDCFFLLDFWTFNSRWNGSSAI